MFYKASLFGKRLCNWSVNQVTYSTNMFTNSSCTKTSCLDCTYTPTSVPSSSLDPPFFTSSSLEPSILPSVAPSVIPSSLPTSHTTSLPSSEPSSELSVLPTSVPTLFPSIGLSVVPSVGPTLLSTSLSFLQSDTFLIICVGSALALC